MEEKATKVFLVSGPVIVKNNKVLLNQHGDTEFWKFCGGSANNFNTRLTDIAIQKAKEEMGLDIKLADNQPFFMHIVKELETGPADVVLVHFLAKLTSETIRPADFIRKWAWISLKDLKNENLAPNIIPALKHFGFIK